RALFEKRWYRSGFRVDSPWVKTFERVGLSAFLLTRILTRDARGHPEEVELSGCVFLPGVWHGANTPSFETALPAGEVDPVVMDEVLGLLHELAGMKGP